MPNIFDMLNQGCWTDADFGYDMDYDFFAERHHIVRPDGRVLYSVPTLNSSAHYSVHFCVDAQEIWAVDLYKLAPLVEFDRRFVKYSPTSKSKGLPSARGYCLPCELVREAGHCWDMDTRVLAALRKAPNKGLVGDIAEKAFLWLVNVRDFFPQIFKGKATKTSTSDDVRGVDAWINETIPVQVKVDGPGGGRSVSNILGTGNLFFQTHTLAMRDCADWYGYKRDVPN